MSLFEPRMAGVKLAKLVVPADACFTGDAIAFKGLIYGSKLVKQKEKSVKGRKSTDLRDLISAPQGFTHLRTGNKLHGGEGRWDTKHAPLERAPSLGVATCCDLLLLTHALLVTSSQVWPLHLTSSSLTLTGGATGCRSRQNKIASSSTRTTPAKTRSSFHTFPRTQTACVRLKCGLGRQQYPRRCRLRRQPGLSKSTW